MRLSLVLPAVFGVVVMCLATDRAETEVFKLPNVTVERRQIITEGAATIFKAPYFVGNFNPTDYTNIAPGWCVDLNNIYGAWDPPAGSIKSIRIDKGFKCSFHMDYHCKRTPGRFFVMGLKDKIHVVPTTDNTSWDKAIHSLRCDKF